MVRFARQEDSGIMQESSLAHTKRDCACHIVWIPKYRRKVLYGEREREVSRLIRELPVRKPGTEIAEGKVCPGHVRLCVRITPKYSVSDVMGYVKGKSALILYDCHPEWRGWSSGLSSRPKAMPRLSSRFWNGFASSSAAISEIAVFDTVVIPLSTRRIPQNQPCMPSTVQSFTGYRIPGKGERKA